MRITCILLMLLPHVLFSQTGAVINPKNQVRIITVGGTNATIPGYTNEAIQMAIEVTPGVITDIKDNVVYVDTYLIRDYTSGGNGSKTGGYGFAFYGKQQNERTPSWK